MKIVNLKMLKKLLVSSLAALVLFFSIAPTTARAVWYNQSFDEFHNIVHDEATPPQEIFGERYTYAQVQWIIYSLMEFAGETSVNQKPEVITCGIGLARRGENQGLNIADCVQAAQALGSTDIGQSNLANKPKQNFVSFMTSDRPISAITSVKNSIKKLNPSSNVYAQTGAGFGYDTALGDMIQNLWSHARNIAYSLFIFLAIILAFMIMFRVKLNPQTVISIQSAIPKLFITLILITFSYAIAGFLVDLMYVVIGLFALMMNPVLGTDNLFSVMTTGLQGTGVWGFAILNIIGMAVAFVGAVGAMLGGLLRTLGTFTGIGIVLFIIALVAFFIILLWTTFKIIMALLRAYVEFILHVITGPLQIAVGVVYPGTGFGPWLRNLASNLAVFPLAGVLFTLSYMFLVLSLKSEGILGETLVDLLGYELTNVSGNVNTGGGWPPLIGINVGDIAPMALFALSFTMYALIPKAADLIKGAVSGRGFAYGLAIGEAVGVASGYAGGRLAEVGSGQLPFGAKQFYGGIGKVTGFNRYAERIGQTRAGGAIGGAVQSGARSLHRTGALQRRWEAKSDFTKPTKPTSTNT